MAYNPEKATKLKHLKSLAEKANSTFATKTSVNNLETRVNEIVASGGEPNAINKILVNNVEQTITEDKGVNLTVPTKVSDLTNDSKFQSDTEVATAIQAAIAATGHAVFTKVDTVPTADAAEDNVLYLVMNADTNHYDIYAKVGNEVVLVDDTTVDLTKYSTTEQMNAAIAAAVEALNIGQYATVTAVNGVITRVSTLETKVAALEAVGATKTEASETNGNIKINGVETVVYTEPADAMHGEFATDAEVEEMLTEVFGA